MVWNDMSAYQTGREESEILEIEKVRAKEAAKACVRLEERQIRQQMKEVEEERRRCQGENLVFCENGELQLITTNLSFKAEPRRLTNIVKPQLTVLRHEADMDERLFRVDFQIGERNLQIFLEPSEIGSSNYILKKFASVGAFFYLKKSADAKLVTVKLICILQEMFTEEEILPDDVGWIKSASGKWRYVEEGDMTWERAKKLAKK